MSLQTVLIVPLILQVLLVLIITSWLSFHNGQRVVVNIASSLNQEIGQRIQLHLKRYLEIPHQFNQSQEAVFENQWLTANDLSQIGKFFLNRLHDHPSLKYTAWGNEQGRYVGIAKTVASGYEIELVENPLTQAYYTYSIDLGGNRGAFLRRSPPYDPRTRPWYIEAKRSQKARWSSIYVWFDNSKIAIDAVLPIYGDIDHTNLLGVLDTPITLEEISNFLRSLRIGKTGQAFIMERSGLLVASSSHSQLFRSQNGQLQRIYAFESENSQIARLSQELISQNAQKANSLASGDKFHSLNLEIDHEQYFVQLLNFQDDCGLDWLVVTSIPHRDFSEEIYAIIRRNLAIATVIILIAIIFLIRTSRFTVNQIIKVAQKANAISKGDWQKPIAEIGATELRILARSFNQMSSQLQESFENIEYAASHDLLTGLPNRLSFLNALEAEIATLGNIANQENLEINLNNQFAVLFFDLDNFKRINDGFGHLTGDILLRDVAVRVQECLSEQDLLARFGGDEFTILLRHLNNPYQEAIAISEKIIQALRQPFCISAGTFFISTSIGIALSNANHEYADSYLRDADTAMYNAKKAGKDRYAIYSITMYEQIVERLHLETELRHSLERKEFLVYYQPITSLQNNQIVGFEALVRWNHPTLGFVPPSKFIQIAEEAGQISHITKFVLRQACTQLKLWQERYSCAKNLFVNVNLSSRDFLDPMLVHNIDTLIKEIQLPPQSLKLELTESIIVSNMQSVRLSLQELRSLGIGICIDDFGTGYCSLQYLLLLPANTLKIDKIFIEQLTANKQAEQIVSLFVNLAHGVNMEAVAEGIEIQEHVDIMRRLNCDFGQGYFWSPPLPVSQVEKILQYKEQNPKS
ncbi:MAG: EAL domain-containing protein [Pseudanabaenaceae cyanobacterium bins.39]|nr:EAL domain-containing protein [Pseudanabaenaceae cyanobacterium bins.39]